jgi:hypothetical protein
MSELRAHLQFVCDFMTQKLPGFVSPQAFIAQHGIEFQAAKLPADIKPMAVKQCFANSLALVQRRPDLIYCEGYAAGIIPTVHAWCVTSDGTVVDPTWTGDLQGEEYIGIPFQTQFVVEQIANRRYYGVIEDWQNEYPLANGKFKVEEYLHPLFQLPV